MKANIHTIGDHTLRMPNMYYSSMMVMVKCIGSNPINALNSINFFYLRIYIITERKRNSKCKVKATLIKFNYSEYDACIKNNNIEEISIVSREWCGTNKIKLSYNEGTFADTPYNCLDKINVSWKIILKNLYNTTKKGVQNGYKSLYSLFCPGHFSLSIGGIPG